MTDWTVTNLRYRQRHVARLCKEWDGEGDLPYQYEGTRDARLRRYWYFSITKDVFGNSVYANHPDSAIEMCNKCATKGLRDLNAPWPWARQAFGGGHCDLCGDDDGLVINLDGQGYGEGFHSRND